MFYKSNGEIIDKNKIVEVLGEDIYNDLLEIKDEIKLDRTLFGYFDRCFIANQVLAKHNFYLKFFERRDRFRFLIQKKVQGKMKSQKTSRALSLKKLLDMKDKTRSSPQRKSRYSSY